MTANPDYTLESLREALKSISVWAPLSETDLSGLGGPQSALNFKSSLSDLMHSQG